MLCRDIVKAFILAAMSEFMFSGAPLAATGAPGGRRAAAMLPKGCEEGVMFETVEAEVMSEVVRSGGGDRTGGLLSRGGEMLSSGEVGGEGSRGKASSSGVDMVTAV